MEKAGTKHQFINWFKSYLNSRKQYVRYSEGATPSEEIKCSVPQGSVLGPLLFFIFVNDLQHVTKFLEPIMFADDTNLFYSNSYINELFENANKELAKATDLCFGNKLLINTSKTKCLFFS